MDVSKLSDQELLKLIKEAGIDTSAMRSHEKSQSQFDLSGMSDKELRNEIKEAGIELASKDTSIKHKVGVGARSLLSNVIGAFSDLAMFGVNAH